MAQEDEEGGKGGEAAPAAEEQRWAVVRHGRIGFWGFRPKPSPSFRESNYERRFHFLSAKLEIFCLIEQENVALEIFFTQFDITYYLYTCRASENFDI